MIKRERGSPSSAKDNCDTPGSNCEEFCCTSHCLRLDVKISFILRLVVKNFNIVINERQ
jgi:hypothetical protein